MYGTSSGLEEAKEAFTPGHEHRFEGDTGQAEIGRSRFHQAVLCEWFGTSMLTMFIVLVYMTGAVDVIRVSMTAGLTYFVLAFMFFGTSGAHFNPAVSLALAFLQRMSFVRMFFYIIAQVLGGITGAALARSISISMFNAVDGGANMLLPGTSPGSGVWLELLGTTLFVMAVLAASDKSRTPRWTHRKALVPLQLGFSLLLVHMVLVPFTRCSVNPARSFGSAIVKNYWRSHWVFWIGPVLGAIAGALLYSVLFFFQEEPPAKDVESGFTIGALPHTQHPPASGPRVEEGRTGSRGGV